MRFVHIYLIGYFVLILGAGLALWQAGVLGRIPGIWILISGIIVVGALLEIGQGNVWVTALSTMAILLASINIFGGFAVTRRMLSMFSRS